MLMQSQHMDTRMVLLAFGIVDKGGECESCGRHTLTLDTYWHDGELRQYCNACAEIFAEANEHLTNTLAGASIIANLFENDTPN